MVGEMARVTRRGGIVAALNEGTRARRAQRPSNPDQAEEKEFGINEHVHTLYAYLWASGAAGSLVRRVEHAEGDDDLASRRIGGKLLGGAGRRPARPPGSRRPATATRAPPSSLAELRIRP